MNDRHDRYRSEPLRQSDRGQPVPTGARMMTVMRMKGLSDKARLVLAVLANHDGAGGCYPSRALIASEASMSPRSVDRALAECRSRGVLNSRQRRGSNVYKIDYGWTAEGRQTAPTAGEVKSLHAASDPPRAAHRADPDPCAGTAARGGRERCLTPRGWHRRTPAPCGGREPRCTAPLLVKAEERSRSLGVVIPYPIQRGFHQTAAATPSRGLFPSGSSRTRVASNAANRARPSAISHTPSYRAVRS